MWASRVFGVGALWGGSRGGCRGGGAGWSGLVGFVLDWGDGVTYEGGGEKYYSCCNEEINGPWLFHVVGLVKGLVRGSHHHDPLGIGVELSTAVTIKF